MAMMMSGDRVAAPMSPSVAVGPISMGSRSASVAVRPPWWCAHRSRSSALGVLTTAVLVCVASAVAVVGFASTGSTLGALVALGVLAVGAANVVSGSFGAAWWARCARASEEVPSMNTTDDRRRIADADDTRRRQQDELPRRPTPVVPAAREPRTPASGGRHAWAPVDEPTTRIPTPPPAAPGHPVPPAGPPQTLAPPRPPGPTDPTEALPTQNPHAAGSAAGPPAGEPDDRPAASTGTVRSAAKRAAARTGPRVRRVAGRPSGDQR